MGFTHTTSLAILATFLLLSTAATAASRKNLASPLCEGADDGALCTSMTKGAKDWPKAMTNMMNAFIKTAKAGKPIAYGIEAKLPGNLSPKLKKSIAYTCKSAYDALIYNLKECKGFVKSDPMLQLKSSPSALTFSDCTMALEEREIHVEEVSKLDDELLKMRNSVLFVVKKNPAYAKFTAATDGSRKNLASPICEGADDRALCSSMTNGAEDWPKAMTNMINAFIKTAKAGKSIAYGIEAKLPGNLSPKLKKSIGYTCKSVYDGLISNLKDCKGLVKNDPMLRLTSLPSSLTFSDCTMALEEREIHVEEVSKLDNELLKMRNNVLIVVKKNPTYAKFYN